MTRLALGTLGVLLLAGLAMTVVAGRRGRSGARRSLLVSVVAGWLAAYALWTFAGGLALAWGALEVYDSTLFGVLALGLGAWQYRAGLRGGPDPALAIFVGGQVAWLVVVGAQNGLFSR
jgi:hypothetical protein